MRYADRMCAVLSGGQHVASVAVLYDAELDWGGEHLPMQKLCRALTEHQIEFDIVCLDMLRDPAQLPASGASRFHLALAPGESCLLSESEDVNTLPVWRFVPESLEACAGRIRPDEWRVSLAPAADPPVFGPAASVRTLRPVSDEQPAFSGLIRYETALTLNEVPQEAWFVPEQVFESLRLTVNGMEAENGVRLTPPYAVEITGLLKEGKMLSWQRSPRRPRGIR